MALRHLSIAFRLLQELGAAGNLTTDVQLAALAMEHQAELHSADADFPQMAQHLLISGWTCSTAKARERLGFAAKIPMSASGSASRG